MRISERNIPEELIRRAVEEGHRVVLADRSAVEYTLKNVLGCRGVDLVVITSKDGTIITSYAGKKPPKGWRY